jgi:cyclase
VIKLANSVYGYEDLRAQGFTTVSFFVVGRDGVLLADGQESAAAMQRLLSAIAKITPKPARWYVVGSDHADYTGGNSVLAHDIRYIVHPTSMKQLERDAIAAAKNPSAYPVVVPPVAMELDRETVDSGDRQVEITFLGRTHTNGDLVVYLPFEKILFMSEVYFNRVFPAMRSAYPTEWIRVIDKALQMDVHLYVPAYGFIEEPGVSRVQLVEFRGAVDYVAGRLHDLGLSPEEAFKQANWGPYGNWMLADSQRK